MKKIVLFILLMGCLGYKNANAQTCYTSEPGVDAGEFFNQAFQGNYPTEMLPYPFSYSYEDNAFLNTGNDSGDDSGSSETGGTEVSGDETGGSETGGTTVSGDETGESQSGTTQSSTHTIKRIYTTEEAAALSKKTGNTFRLRYK
ncbi:MAG: hypothetical protein IJ870_03640 [Alphaproteobacteria bacterium]|nr:hypothetical protein [Alphaproteobacteria bacterium]